MVLESSLIVSETRNETQIPRLLRLLMSFIVGDMSLLIIAWHLHLACGGAAAALVANTSLPE